MFVVGEVWALHAVPFHFNITPPSPAAHTLVVLVPHTAFKLEATPDVGAAHAVPSHFMMAPPAPTAQALFASKAHNEFKVEVVFEVCGFQIDPLS